MSRKNIIIAILVTITLAIILGVNYYLTSKNTLTIEQFSQNFITDFATYNMGATQAYNDNVIKYIAPEYREYFGDLYFLQKQSFVPTKKINNFSRYVSSVITAEEKSKNNYNVTIDFQTVRKNMPAKESEFTEKNSINLMVRKDGKNFYITNLTFATPEQ